MHFEKWQALGNDFILLPPGERPAADVKLLCDRHFGIGADGVVVIEPLGGTVFRMRIFNSDGGEVEMCGNATRCVGLFIRNHRFAAGREFELRTGGGVVRPRVEADNRVTVDMGEPREFLGELNLSVDGREFQAHTVSMGNPHAVIFVPDPEKIELERWGAALERHPVFPNRCNIEFAGRTACDRIRMRVWERGCGVTLACGTGSCATAVAARRLLGTPEAVTVELDGGELAVRYGGKPGDHVFMTGPATHRFDGVWND